MGEMNVKLAESKEQMAAFVQNLLKDVQALEKMLDSDVFEKGIRRIGVEQEMCIVDKQSKPAPMAMEFLDLVDDEMYTTELAKFNLEFNVEPMIFDSDCLSKMENRIVELLDKGRTTAQKLDCELILTGILPTIRKFDLGAKNITPVPRYYALSEAIEKLRGESYELKIRGVDELILRDDTTLLEASNTGFQVHFQTHPSEFVSKYNLAQAIAGPALAPGVNSPLLLGKRLWHETRIALFQQSVDTRKSGQHIRDSSPRVTFGTGWLNASILEIYKEDIARFKVLLSNEIEENALESLSKGIVPGLRALQVHNGTVYRWNRPCYGVVDNVPHLRIENRVLPAGPSVVDEMANAALWLGCMNHLDEVYPNINQIMSFDIASENFMSACRNGLNTAFTWLDGKKYDAPDLLKNELIPIAREGLKKANIVKKDIDRYLDILEERVSKRITGSQWMMDSIEAMLPKYNREEIFPSITSAIIEKQRDNEPIHKWALASVDDISDWEVSNILVEECMTTDLFTASTTDIVGWAAGVMDWRKIRYMPVEDNDQNLVGLITAKKILKCFVNAEHMDLANAEMIEKGMIKDPITIAPQASIVDAMTLMEKHKIGCLPVLDNKKLVGILTEQDFLRISSRLVKRLIRAQQQGRI